MSKVTEKKQSMETHFVNKYNLLYHKSKRVTDGRLAERVWRKSFEENNRRRKAPPNDADEVQYMTQCAHLFLHPLAVVGESVATRAAVGRYRQLIYNNRAITKDNVR
jgi:hypothetical protein